MIDFNKTLELASQNTQKKIQSNEILPTASKNSNILPTANKKVQNMQNRVLKTAQYSAKQQALQKQKRKEDEEEAWNNLKTLENSYQEKDKWLLANLDQNNTVLGTVTDEYREKYEEKRQAEEAYMNAFSNYYNEYKEEYDQRLKESNQKSKEQFLGTVKKGALTVADAGINLLQSGITDIAEGIADAGTYAIAQAYDAMGYDEDAQRLRQNAQVNIMRDRVFGEVNDYLAENSYLGDTGRAVTQGIGQSAALGLLAPLPGVSTGVLWTSSLGNNLNEAYATEGISDAKAWAKAGSAATLEVAVEKLYTSLGYGGSSLDDMVMNSTEKINNGLAKAIVQTGATATGEGIEEMLTYAGNYLIDHGLDLIDENGQLSKEWDNEELWENFFVGALSSGISQGAVNSYKYVKNRNNSNKANFATQNETLPTANQEATTVADVLPTASEQKSNNTESTMLPTAKDNVLPTANKQNVENVATKNNEVTTNLQEEIGLSISNDNMLPYANSENLAVKKYQYVESDNTKINDIRKDASQYFTDSEQAHKFIETLEKVIVDKDLAIRLNDNVRTEDNKIANGKYDSGTVTIDPSSPKALESIAIHEATHAIGTKSMLKIVDTYRKSDAEFNSNVQALLDNYNVTELNEEVLADVSSELFGTQEFINNVADAHPTLFQKIYSEIKYLWHQFRGYKTQGQFIEDLYFKWNQAYNSSNKLNNTTNYHVSENFSNEIDKALNNQLKTNTQVKARDFTPQILVDNGVENLPMLITQKHIKSIIYTLQEAENLGLPTKDTNYHGLGKDLLIKAIDNLDNPQAIYKTNENNYLVVTEFKDSNGKEIVVPIQINGNGRYNDVFIAENQIKSVYGRNNLDNYIGRNNFEQIYKKNKELDFNEGIQYSNVANSSIDNSIAPQNNDVNTTTKYSTQESENNTTKLQDRISGDKLLDTQDFINEIKSVGAEVDENGYVTVYHQTSTENANKIKESGMMSGKEDGIFFSTSKEAQQSEGRGTEKLTFKIPAEILQLDDIFDNNADVRIPLKNKNEIIDVSKYLINTENSSSTNYLLNKEESLSKVKEGYTRLYRGLENKYNPNYDKTLLDNNNGYESWTDNYDLAKSYGENVYYIDVPTSEIKNSVINEDASSETYGDRNLIYLNDKPVGIKGKSGNEYMLYTDHENYNDIVYNKVDVNETTSDIRYSKKSNNSWQKYLEENFRAKGTRTYAKDILFQTSNESKSTPSKDILVKKADSENSYTKKTEIKQEQEKIASILEKPAGKVPEKDRTWAIFKANIIDKGIVFEELSRKANNRELQGKWDYTLTATARGQNAIGQARYEMDANTKTEKQICKSLEDIRAEVGDKTSEFQQYMYHQLNIDRMTLTDRFAENSESTIKNKPVFGNSVTAEVSKEIVNQYEKSNPEFKKWAQDVYDYNNANKQELVKSGVISQELSDKLSDMYPHYVPIKRVNSKGNAINVPLDTNRTGINSPLAKAKGGNQDIQPLFETLAERTLQTYKASAKNNFGVELMNTLNTVQEKQVASIDTILEEIGDADSNNELLKEGKNGNLPTFTVFDNGEKVTFEISRDMYDALKPVSDSSILSKTIKPLNAISNARRGVLNEYNLLFSLTNAIKDAQDVVINSQHPAKTYAKFPEAYYQILKKGYWYNEYVRNGGEQNSYFKDGEFESNKKVSKLKTALKTPLDKISSINNVIEMAPRLSEYIASRENGASIETAMLDASRVTTNFKAGGDIIKFANRNGATFLNASVQGFQQQVRNVQEANAKGLKGYAVLATKYAIAGMPALILNQLLWKDDEDYDELQDYVKDNYYIVAKYGDGKFIRIPKGRMAATMQKIVGNVAEYVTGEKELNIDNLSKDFWEDLKFTIDNVAPNNPLDNNVISPIVQAVTNKSWYGEDIVPSRLQDKPEAEQYDETIDSFSIWLGGKLNVSPYKINYLLDQYGGGVSDIILPMLTKQAENNVVEDKFTTDSVMKSKYPGEFYSKLDEVTTVGNSDKASDKDILASKYVSSVSEEMSELYKKKREIQSSDLSDKAKKTKVKEVQKKINALAQGGLESLEKFSTNNSDVSNTAVIGNEQYYKLTNVSDGSMTWRKVSDDEAKKIKNIPLETYADYKEQVAQETIKQRKKRNT